MGMANPQAFECTAVFLFGVDAQDLALGIDQRPAAVSRTDLGIGLDVTAFVAGKDS